MVDYARLAATAKRLIEANGRSITLLRANSTPTDASKPWRGAAASAATALGGASITAIGVFVSPSGSQLGRTRREDGTLSVVFEQVCLVAAASLPAGTDLEEFTRVTDGGRVWRIEVVEPLNPGSTALVYSLGLVS